MTVVPLPDTACVRVRTIWNEGQPGEGSNRFYLSYSGSAPSGANCSTLATDIQSAWGTHLAGYFTNQITLNEVDVLDIATDSGLSGQWTGSTPGTGGSGPSAIQTAVNVEFGIGRRYRGGKPRSYFPPFGADEFDGVNLWNPTTLAAFQTAVAAYFAEIVALSVGSMGTLAHINLSYYKGYTNLPDSSGRVRAVPTYRATALHDNVTGYFAKQIISSQRRRRSSTTP